MGLSPGISSRKPTAGACSSTAAAGVLFKLRELEDWPHVDAICLTHFLDHWGDVVPWVWALSFGPASELPPPELWVPPGGRTTLREIGQRLGFPDMFEDAFRVSEYRRAEAFETAGMSVTARRVLADLLAFGFRVSCNGKTVAYSGDSGPSDELTSSRATPTSFSARRRCWSRIPRAGREAISRRTRRKRPSRPPAPAAPPHPPPQGAPAPPEFEQVHDGQEIDV